jgi:transcription elongation GreA/GreB family factor
MTFKQKIYNQFRQMLETKISGLQQQLNDLKESTANETKSTAGDKYETARAMLQIEQDNTRRQLQEAMEQQSIFTAIDISISSNEISRGSLVKTNKGYLFISIALGKIIVDGITVIALSPQSPLGRQLMSLRTNDTTAINNISYTIEKIL